MLAWAEERLPKLDALTPAIRERIDRLALRQPPQKTAELSVDLAGDLTVWLLRRVSLTAEEEQEAAAPLHRRILEEHKGRIRLTPAALSKTFDSLLSGTPDHLKPDIFRYSLTILDSTRPAIFSSGAGHVYLTTRLLDALAPETERGRAVLAFLLAREIGHIGMGHCRRGYQLEQLTTAGEKELRLKKGMKLSEVLRTTTGVAVPFLYAREQQHDADLFAFHLCRNAGFDLDLALDALRWVTAVQYPGVLTSPDYRAERSANLIVYSVATEPDSLDRLNRLLRERRGELEDNSFGLFLHDRATGKLKRCPDQLAGTDRGCVVFVHGMHGGEDSFETFREFLSDRRETKETPILVYLFPANGSLACAGEMLAREMKRGVQKPEFVKFICHSAGGLVFRYYAEKKRGGFDRAVLMGVPHRGSEMTPLKFLSDLVAFGGDLDEGIAAAIRATVNDGRGHLTPDVKPGSLFLRYLGRDEKLAARYHVIYGKFLPLRGSRTALRLAFTLARRAGSEVIRNEVESALLRRMALRVVDGLTLPDEVLDGDLIVSVDSANLEGAGKVTATKLSHPKLKKDEDVMLDVVEYFWGAKR
jgi:pimeloyl-ACP methyl ester carboxylesterase